MAYAPGFQHDVFISYAVADNDGPYHEKRGWVQAFEEQLKAELQREVRHKRAVDIWLDRNRLSCGDLFDDGIRDALGSTAVLVVLLSKQYLASEWCRLEREGFLNVLARQKQGGKRLFVVELTNPAELSGSLPDDFARIHRVRLWESQGNMPRRLGHPVPDQAKIEHQGFYDRTLEVAYAIAKRLEEFGGESPAPAASAVGHVPAPSSAQTAGEPSQQPSGGVSARGGPAIYLCQPPRGTDEERFTHDLKNRLENAIPPVQVLPDQPLSKTPDEAAQYVQSQLAECQLYVHVVGHNPGSAPAGFAAPLPELQKRLADQASRPCLLWRLPNVSPADIDDGSQRALAEQALAGDVEDCRRTVLDRLQELARIQSSPSPPAEDAFDEQLFVNHLPDDEELARTVCRTLAQHQYLCVKRSFDGATEEELRLDFEQNLRTCGRLVMVYGKATKPAAKAQLLECLKVVGRRQPTGRSIGAWFIVAGPPPKLSASLDLFFDGLREIDCGRDLEAPLVAALAEARQGAPR
jgi:hypothetical protein